MNRSDQPETKATAHAARDNLSRGFGLSTATFVVVASMVGTGILVSPGYMMLSLENHLASLVLWLLGGALAWEVKYFGVGGPGWLKSAGTV